MVAESVIKGAYSNIEPKIKRGYLLNENMLNLIESAAARNHYNKWLNKIG